MNRTLARIMSLFVLFTGVIIVPWIYALIYEKAILYFALTMGDTYTPRMAENSSFYFQWMLGLGDLITTSFHLLAVFLFIYFIFLFIVYGLGNGLKYLWNLSGKIIK